MQATYTCLEILCRELPQLARQLRSWARAAQRLEHARARWPRDCGKDYCAPRMVEEPADRSELEELHAAFWAEQDGLPIWRVPLSSDPAATPWISPGESGLAEACSRARTLRGSAMGAHALGQAVAGATRAHITCQHHPCGSRVGRNSCAAETVQLDLGSEHSARVHSVCTYVGHNNCSFSIARQRRLVGRLTDH